MRRLPIPALVLCLAVAATAGDIYRWTDANGRVHYGDKPPAAGPARKLDDENRSGFSVMTTIEVPAETESASPARRKRSRRVFSSWHEGASGYASAVRQQKQNEVPLLVYFRTDWCPHCRRLDAMLAEPEVDSYLARFVRVRINPEHGPSENELFKRYGGSGYPSLYLQQKEGSAPVKLSSRGPVEAFLQRFRALDGSG